MKKKPYVKPETKSNDLEELKRFMNYSVSVEHWNEKREIAKKYFTPITISHLDASGFITRAIREVTAEDVNAIL